MPQHRKKVTVRLQPQTLYHLTHLALIAGYEDDIGKVIDKMMRTYRAKDKELEEKYDRHSRD